MSSSAQTDPEGPDCAQAPVAYRKPATHSEILKTRNVQRITPTDGNADAPLDLPAPTGRARIRIAVSNTGQPEIEMLNARAKVI